MPCHGAGDWLAFGKGPGVLGHPRAAEVGQAAG